MFRKLKYSKPREIRHQYTVPEDDGYEHYTGKGSTIERLRQYQERRMNMNMNKGDENEVEQLWSSRLAELNCSEKNKMLRVSRASVVHPADAYLPSIFVISMSSGISSACSSTGAKSEEQAELGHVSSVQLIAKIRTELNNLESVQLGSKPGRVEDRLMLEHLAAMHEQLRSLRLKLEDEGCFAHADENETQQDADMDNSDTNCNTDAGSSNDSDSGNKDRKMRQGNNVDEVVTRKFAAPPQMTSTVVQQSSRTRNVSYQDNDSADVDIVQSASSRLDSSRQSSISDTQRQSWTLNTNKQLKPTIETDETNAMDDNRSPNKYRSSIEDSPQPLHRADTFNQDAMSTGSGSSSGSGFKLPKVVHQHTVASLEYLQGFHSENFNRIRTVSIENNTGDILYIDDSGRNIKRLHPACECFKLATGSYNNQRTLERSYSVNESQKLGITVLHSSDKKIGGACWLHNTNGSMIAFVQGRDTVKIYDVTSQKLKQRIRIKGVKAAVHKDTEMYHSCIFERANGHLIIGFSGGTTLYDFAYSYEKNQYVLYRSVPITIEMLCFTYNPVLEMVGFLFHNSPACPLLLDWNYDEYAYLRLQRSVATRPPQPSQILILDSGFVLLNDWSPPCQIHVFNLEGNRIGAVKMHQCMISSWAIRRPFNEIEAEERLRRAGSKTEDEVSLKFEKGNDTKQKANHVVSIDMITTQLDNIVKSTQNSRSLIYFYDMTLHCLSEIVLDKCS